MNDVLYCWLSRSSIWQLGSRPQDRSYFRTGHHSSSSCTWKKMVFISMAYGLTIYIVPIICPRKIVSRPQYIRNLVEVLYVYFPFLPQKIQKMCSQGCDFIIIIPCVAFLRTFLNETGCLFFFNYKCAEEKHTLNSTASCHHLHLGQGSSSVTTKEGSHKPPQLLYHQCKRQQGTTGK